MSRGVDATEQEAVSEVLSAKTTRTVEGLSIVVPAFNESDRIHESLQHILEYVDGRFTAFEILVIDDGSSDDTVELARSISHPAVRCLVNDRNRGKGYSVRRGMLEAGHDMVLFSDADLSTPIEELEKLVESARSGFDVVIASRWLERGQDVRRGALRHLQGRVFAWVVRRTTLGGFRDTQCGFKLFRRDAAHQIFSLQRIDRWGFDVEMLYIARKLGYRIAEVPVRWYQSGESKVRLSAPFSMLIDLLRIRWNALLGRYGR